MLKVIGACGQVHQYDLRGRKGRIFTVTDVHGHFDLLYAALRDVAFDSSRDLLVSTGDWVDRGPQSQYVLDWLDEPWVLSCQGNHEELQIRAFESGYANDCTSTMTLAQHGGWWSFDLPRVKQLGIIEMFKSLPLSIELLTDFGTVGIIHAEVPYQSWTKWREACKSEVENHCIAEAQWSRRRYRNKDSQIVEGIDAVIVGHTPTDSYEFEHLGNVVYSDVGVHRNKHIKLLEINQEFMEKVNERKTIEVTGTTRRSRSQRL